MSEKKEAIDFQEPRKASYSNLHDSQLFSFEPLESINMDEDTPLMKETEHIGYFKKIKNDSGEFTTKFEFRINGDLILLLRNPDIDEGSIDFSQKYLEALWEAIRCTLPKESDIKGALRKDGLIELLYFHLVLAQVENLGRFEELNLKEIPALSRIYEETNIMNVHCISNSLEEFLNKQDTLQESKGNISEIVVNIIFEENVYEHTLNHVTLSQNILRRAVEKNGEYDLECSAFILSHFKDPLLLHFFSKCIGGYKIQQKYGQTYQERFEEEKKLLISDPTQKNNVFSESKSSLSNPKSKEERIEFYEHWYEDQVQKLINKKFEIEKLKELIVSGEKNHYIEKLLIGLQGWNEKYAEDSTILLNVYYDNCDWQLNSPFRPSIAEVGEKFQVNYLVEDRETSRRNLILCLKAPCMLGKDEKKKQNQKALNRKEVFSWHHLRIRQYQTDGVTYLWIEKTFSNFQKCGFYDWKLFELTEKGVNSEVNKILSLSDNKRLGSQIISKKIYAVKPVQGRVIVHPNQTRSLQIHEIYMDSLSANESKKSAVPHFQDAVEDIKRYADYGIDCTYIMGVFQRDTGKFEAGFKRPNASPMALTSKTSPCEMLGGSSGFNHLIEQSHHVGMKIITDCATRVSSSRSNRCYDPFLLHYIDDGGRKQHLYGGSGRSVNYEDTTVLNYRKIEAWNLLIDQTCRTIRKFRIDGVYLDNGITWPQIFQVDLEEMMRKEKNEEGENKMVYTNQEIIDGEVVVPNKPSGYWMTEHSHYYPNPFYVKLAKEIWSREGDFLFICESFDIEDQDVKTISAIQSGLIPRLFKMPKAVSQVMGINLKENGTISTMEKKNMTSLKNWYIEESQKLPKNSIIVQSTSSHTWPYPAFLFKKATWAFIDLLFFLPEIPMTFIGEQDGRAYRSKATSIFFDAVNIAKGVTPNANKYSLEQKSTFKKSTSSFFSSSNFEKEKLITSSNATVKDPSQIKYLEEAFRRQIGPEFGFDLNKIHLHYKHRRKIRKELHLLTSGKMLALSAEHKYGVHQNILSFAKWDSSEILLISINFNEAAIDMHYNLTNLKNIFTKPYNSNKIVKIEEVMGKSGFLTSYYTVSELIASRIEAHIEAYQSIIWKVTFPTDVTLQEVSRLSCERVQSKITSQPPMWIYSSVFTNELSYMLETTKSLRYFVNKLSFLYDKLIVPNDLSFNMVISKTYEFWTNKNKLSKLFGIFKLLEDFPEVTPSLKVCVKNLIEGNSLGPIAFITPEVGKWSSVGGLGVMVIELAKELVKLGEEVYIITPYYEYDKKKNTNYLIADGFQYQRNIKVWSGQIGEEFGLHCGKYEGVNYVWFHNPSLFSKPYDGEGALFVTKQMTFFALASLEALCQLHILPSTIVTNDWMCGFVSAYAKVHRFGNVFDGTKFMHICHNLDPLYQGRIYPETKDGDLNWLIKLPSEWYTEYREDKFIINPSKCALETCDNWGTVSNSYKYDLLKNSPLSYVLWKHHHPFSFPNGVRKDERVGLLKLKTPGTHEESKKVLQEKYFKFYDPSDEIPIFAFIGRVTKQKGVHLIVDAVQALLYEFNFKIQFIVGGMSDSKESYGKYCADRMKYLTHKYPKCFWSDPDAFFTDGPLVNIGSDYALMPSEFEPGGIVQHEFFCGGTPVIAFRTGGLKDTVFEYDSKAKKGNGFNFMSYDVEDFKKCIRRAMFCYKSKQHYQILRENAFNGVVEEEDVAKGWNTEFYRLHNKIYIDWEGVEKEIQILKDEEAQEIKGDDLYHIGDEGHFWSEDWDIKQDFKLVLKNAQRLKTKDHTFVYESSKIPRPTDVFVAGSWDDWKKQNKMNFDTRRKKWSAQFKLTPGAYYYKYIVDGEWVLNPKEEIEVDAHGIENNIITIQ